jgi:hypothetical protein
MPSEIRAMLAGALLATAIVVGRCLAVWIMWKNAESDGGMSGE